MDGWMNALPIEHSLLVAAKECFTSLPIYMSIHDDEINAANEKFWNTYGMLRPNYQQGYRDRIWADCVKFVFPDCCPERIELLVYIGAWMVELDDMLLNENDGHNKSTDKLDIFEDTISAEMLLRVLELDKTRGIRSIEAMHRVTNSRQTRRYEFSSLDDYLSYRIVDGGGLAMHDFIAFSAQLDVLDTHERSLIDPILNSIGINYVLVNDYFSWNKESKEEDKLVNAIAVVMKTRDTSLLEAKECIKAMIIQYEQIYSKKIGCLRANPSVSPAAIRYLDAQVRMSAGFHYWSASSPRYHDAPIITTVDDPNGMNTTAPVPTGDQHESSGSLEMDEIIPVMPEIHSPQTHLDSKLVLAPYLYTKSLPSKNIRDKFIKALNTWLMADSKSLQVTLNTINLLHNSSLMVDDIEDGSSLRRGHPATHTIFGTSQTINSANYSCLLAVAEVDKLFNKSSLPVFIEEVQGLHIGQSFDLFWRQNLIFPSEGDYINMIEKKTGGLFRLAAKLLNLNSEGNRKLNYASMEPGLNLISRYYQVRDDYMNLTSEEYTKTKGFCEDLDEGKISMPVLHSLRSQPDNVQLRSILSRRANVGTMSDDIKKSMLGILHATGSLEYTKNYLKNLEEEITKEMNRMEHLIGVENPGLRLLLTMLFV